MEGLPEGYVSPEIKFKYGYDSLGARKISEFRIDDALATRTTYEADYQGRITKLEQNHADAGANLWANATQGMDRTIVIQYWSDGRRNILNRLRNVGDDNVVDSSFTIYDYDYAGRLVGLSHKRPLSSAEVGMTNAIATYEFEYVNESIYRNWTTFYTSEDDGSETHASRLAYRYYQDHSVMQIGTQDKGSGFSAPGDITWSTAIPRDPNGVTDEADDVAGKDNRLIVDSKYLYQYDNEGNIVSRDDLADAAGVNLDYFVWDHRNQLIASSDGDGDDAYSVKYFYDALGRKIATLDVLTGEVTRFALDGSSIVAELDLNSGGKITRSYFWGPGGNELLAIDQVDGATIPLWTFGDLSGSIRTIASDAPTWTIIHRDFDLFGELGSNRIYGDVASSLFTNVPLVWAGHFRDEIVGLYDMQARWFDPISHRFLSQDPTGFAAGDTNLYRYVGNNPINYVDPNGRLAFLAGAAIGAFAAGAAAWSFFTAEAATYDEISDVIGSPGQLSQSQVDEINGLQNRAGWYAFGGRVSATVAFGAAAAPLSAGIYGAGALAARASGGALGCNLERARWRPASPTSSYLMAHFTGRGSTPKRFLGTTQIPDGPRLILHCRR